jgi:hypothetical protein
MQQGTQVAASPVEQEQQATYWSGEEGRQVQVENKRLDFVKRKSLEELNCLFSRYNFNCHRHRLKQ